MIVALQHFDGVAIDLQMRPQRRFLEMCFQEGQYLLPDFRSMRFEREVARVVEERPWRRDYRDGRPLRPPVEKRDRSDPKPPGLVDDSVRKNS